MRNIKTILYKNLSVKRDGRLNIKVCKISDETTTYKPDRLFLRYSVGTDQFFNTLKNVTGHPCSENTRPTCDYIVLYLSCF